MYFACRRFHRSLPITLESIPRAGGSYYFTIVVEAIRNLRSFNSSLDTSVASTPEVCRSVCFWNRIDSKTRTFRATVITNHHRKPIPFYFSSIASSNGLSAWVTYATNGRHDKPGNDYSVLRTGKLIHVFGSLFTVQYIHHIAGKCYIRKTIKSAHNLRQADGAPARRRFGHMMSSGTWLLDIPGAICYRCYPASKSVSPIVFEILGPDISGSRPWHFKVMRRQQSRDQSIRHMPFPIGDPLEPSQPFSRYSPPPKKKTKQNKTKQKQNKIHCPRTPRTTCC